MKNTLGPSSLQILSTLSYLDPEDMDIIIPISLRIHIYIHICTRTLQSLIMGTQADAEKL